MEAFKSLPKSWWGAGEKSAGGWFHHLPTDSTTYFHRPEDIV